MTRCVGLTGVGMDRRRGMDKAEGRVKCDSEDGAEHREVW